MSVNMTEAPERVQPLRVEYEVEFQCHVLDDNGDPDGYKTDSYGFVTAEEAWNYVRELRAALKNKKTAREWFEEHAPFSEASGYLCGITGPRKVYVMPVEAVPEPPDLKGWQEPAWVKE